MFKYVCSISSVGPQLYKGLKMVTRLKLNWVSQNLISSTIKDFHRKQLKFISLEEVSKHDTISDCWIILFDKVYDITDFIWRHPGGETILLEQAGQDATRAFHEAGHSQMLATNLQANLIGVLPPHQRLL
ncbi:cytochrome b5 isoform X2 [Nilaparvata lugens]|uniref:cytochrome b5 isoform X2 n=1 Tax=Nilaparvata lugens TaxID=108931 RepID=UPI00193CCF0D|nr:cytochrome b5 isoform X2 [Nilaparvata lugens]